MAHISRRTLLRGTTTAVGVTALGTTTVVGSPVAWAGAGGAGADAYEQVVRDAAMVWRRLPESWHSGPFLGNGTLGVQVEGAPTALRFRLSSGPPGEHRSFLRPVSGDLDLDLAGTVTAVDWTLDLWNAELSAAVTTTRGSVTLRALVLRDRGVLLVSCTPGGGERTRWSLRPADDAAEPVVWHERHTGSGGLVAATVGAGDVHGALTANLDTLVAAHRDRWHAFYRRSFVSVPDRRLQRFYWIQLYKLASSVGPDAAAAGTLAAQVAHTLVNAANHPELDAARIAWRGRADEARLAGLQPWTLRPGAAGLLDMPGVGSKADQTGNPILAWGLFDLWHCYRHTMDTRVLREVLYPALTRAVNFYLPFLRDGADGRLHLPLTHSPHYADAADCTYDLSLLRWAGTALVESAQRLRVDADRVAWWRDIAGRLATYHRDATGVMVGDGTPLAASHPHPSHLLWLYPLREKRWDRDRDRDLMRRSFAHWAGMREAWQGGSYAAAASMAAVMDAPEQALRYLTYFVDGNVAADTALTPNTMYREGANLGMDAPFAAARSLLDLLVQGDAGVLRVFASVPAAWRDVSVAGLRTDGAFVVDAARRGGRTEWIRVHSEAGEPLVVRHDIAGDIDVRDERGAPLRWTARGPGSLALSLPRGATAVINAKGSRPDLGPGQVEASGAAAPWGLAEEER